MESFSVRGDDLHTWMALNDIEARVAADIKMDMPNGEYKSSN